MQRFQSLVPTSLGAAILALAAFSSFTPAQAQLVHTRLARATGAAEVPPVPSPGRGLGAFTIDTVAKTIHYRFSFAGLTSAETAAHIHGFAPPGANAGVLFALPAGSPKCGVLTYTAAQEANILAGLSYVNVHSVTFGGGEIRGQINETPGHQNLCFGDGSGAACPCGNFSVVGEAEGCLNSLGTGGRLRAYGVAQVSADTLVMHHSRGPDSTVLLFQGTMPVGAGGSPFGDGLRCVGGAVIRLGLKTACAGTAYWPDLGEPSLGGFIPGPTNIYYQTWYRNAAAFCTPSTFNLSNAVAVLWMP